MKRRWVFTSVVGMLTSCLLLLAGCSAAAEKLAVEDNEQAIETGRYLVTLGGCHDCHSPKVFTDKGPIPDEARLLSGHPADAKLPEFDVNSVRPDGWLLFNSHLTAAVGPWGVSYAVNLTPDLETGIGRWEEEAFIQSMRTGLHWGVGPPILPPMPWVNLSEAKDKDLRAIFAYLRSVKPVRNEVPAPMSLEEMAAANRQ